MPKERVSGTWLKSSSAISRSCWTRWRPSLEAGVSPSDAGDTDLLAGPARAELAARRRPIVLPELVVRADLDPVPGRCSVGDDARIVIDDPFPGDPGGFDGLARLFGIGVTPGDDAGAEEVKLTVTPIGST